MMIVTSIFVLTLLASTVYCFSLRQAVQKQNQVLVTINESMRAELAKKDRELTTKTMHWARLSDICHEMMDSIDHRFPDADADIRGRIVSLLKSLLSEASDKNLWQDFEAQFMEVHPEFYTRLVEQCPDLTPTEIRTCALLRLNMNTKDIAHMTNRSVRTVESTRLTIRKKLGVERGKSLTPWLIAI